MNPEILSFSGTTLPLGNLTKIASQGIGLSLTYKTDRSPIKFSSDAEYLIALAVLTGISKEDALTILRNLPNRYLTALSYTIIVACDADTTLEVKEYLSCNIFSHTVGDRSILLGTGLLREWHDDIVYNLSSDERSFEFRLLMDKVLLAFEKIGLGALWSNYQKKTQKDQTFLLEYKK